MTARRRDDHPPRLKRLGQHFLSDPRILARIADALELRATETVVEIGPGRGALTDELLPRAGRLIAIEVDRQLAAQLRQRYAGDARVEIVEGDVLRLDLATLGGAGYALVGNVPYYITTPILFHALRAPRPSRAVFLVQREVAERMGAPPGGKTYGALSVNVQALARVEMMFGVAAGAFQPPPNVESSVIRVTPLASPLVAPDQEERYRSFVIAAFGLRRKQMRRVLRSVLGASLEEVDSLLTRVAIDPTARPETLSAADFARLVGAFPRDAPTNALP